MAGTVSTSSLALFLIAATTFLALFLVELGAWLCSPLTASSWSLTVVALAAHAKMWPRFLSFLALCGKEGQVEASIVSNSINLM